MSNNFRFWGKRFGFVKRFIDPKNGAETILNIFTVKQMSVGRENKGPHQLSLDPNSLVGKTAEKQRKAYQASRDAGIVPTLYYRRGRRISKEVYLASA